ncbi:hypothetical protein F2Q70_00000252 [Brassica cretica]|uniref:K-box domain-containing protein n=1 Tax=Brassica cretica TaxID=69181 RepID=A0A8S9IQ61_BRACR|nr:hypothetical protein F2Q70_00000252 [Brassica cretica]
MERILERYERCSYAGQDVTTPSLNSQGECSTECSKLLRMIDVMQRSLRHLNGEEVDALSIRELQDLEMQLDTSLKRTRSRKNQLMVESIAQLKKKGECSTECSKLLRMIDVMQRSLRHLNGEEVDALSIRELQDLEMQLDTSLKRTRSRKNQLMVESIAQLKKKVIYWFRDDYSF